MENGLKPVAGQLHRLNLLRQISAQRIVSKGGLYPGQPPILQYISDHDGCTQNDIAAELQITPASVAVSVKRMEKSGLLSRRSDPDNLRRNQLSITAEGLARARGCKQAFDALDARMFAGFTEEEIEQLSAFFSRLLFNLDQNGALAGKTVASLIEIERQLAHEEQSQWKEK